MDNELLRKIHQFSFDVVRKSFDLRKKIGDDATLVSKELSEFVSAGTQELVKLGASVSDIEKDIVVIMGLYAQEQAREKEPPEPYPEMTEEMLRGEVITKVSFVPMPQERIDDFASGFSGKWAFQSDISATDGVTSFENLEGVGLLLTIYGKNADREEITEGSEIVADSEGNAYLPEYLEFSSPVWQSFYVCEPAVYKFADEVKRHSETLDGLDFDKLIKPHKLKKSDYLSGFDRRSVKDELPYIIEMLREEFLKLQAVYRKAAQNGVGLLLLTGYEGSDTPQHGADEICYTNCPSCGAEYTYVAIDDEKPIKCLCGQEFTPE